MLNPLQLLLQISTQMSNLAVRQHSNELSYSSRQQEEANVSDSDASGDELSDFEATVGDSSHLRLSLLVVGKLTKVVRHGVHLMTWTKVLRTLGTF